MLATPLPAPRYRVPSLTIAKRFIMRIELTGPAKKDLAPLSDRHGMTQVSMVSRLVEFFSGQNELLQSAMIGRYSEEIEGEIAKMLLRKL